MNADARPNLSATAADLPAPVAAALLEPASGRRAVTMVDGLTWDSLAWGDAAGPPILLAHGVTSNAETFRRVGPAVAASGRYVVAVDMPGHGRTGGWRGRHRFAETAADLAEYIRAVGLDRPDLAVLGHSWGGMIVAALPAAGLRPRTLILLDPPTLPLTALREITVDPTNRLYATVAEAEAAIRSENVGWSDGDIAVKALALTQFNPDAVLAVLLENGDWDGGLAALADQAAAGIDTWLIRGEERTGALTLDAAVPAFVARLGADHVITIADAPHSPQRTHPEATVLAILQALE